MKRLLAFVHTTPDSGVDNGPWGSLRGGFTILSKINCSDNNFNGVLETGGLALGEEGRINSEI